MTLREELHRLVDRLDEAQTRAAVEYLRWLGDTEGEALTEEELERVRRGEAEIARGDYVTLDQLRRNLEQ